LFLLAQPHFLHMVGFPRRRLDTGLRVQRPDGSGAAGFVEILRLMILFVILPGIPSPCE
jgi:hypothetical protein